MTKRSFFRRAAAIIAAVALAPEIAFNVKLNPTRLATEPLTAFWLENSCIIRIQNAAYLKWREAVIQTDAWKEFLRAG